MQKKNTISGRKKYTYCVNIQVLIKHYVFSRVVNKCRKKLETEPKHGRIKFNVQVFVYTGDLVAGLYNAYIFLKTETVAGIHLFHTFSCSKIIVLGTVDHYSGKHHARWLKKKYKNYKIEGIKQRLQLQYRGTTK